MKTQWSEIIAHKIWAYIKDDFEFDVVKSFSES